jgi:hypothetical protein
MRSRESEEILRRVRQLNPEPAAPPKPKRKLPTVPLKDDLATLLLEAGPDGYAKATARHFAPGGKYNRSNKHRYALD